MGIYSDFEMPSGRIEYPEMGDIEKKYVFERGTKEEWGDVWLAIALLVFMLFLTWVYFQVPTVHAASNDLYEVHQNDYYCKNLGNYINSGDHKLIDFCAKYVTK